VVFIVKESKCRRWAEGREQKERGSLNIDRFGDGVKRKKGRERKEGRVVSKMLNLRRWMTETFPPYICLHQA
jgi:hypothetical protein